MGTTTSTATTTTTTTTTTMSTVLPTGGVVSVEHEFHVVLLPCWERFALCDVLDAALPHLSPLLLCDLAVLEVRKKVTVYK